MKVGAARSLRGLGGLLALYLCAPFVASLPQVGHADWAGVDWRATWSAVAVSAASASVAALLILAGGVPLGYLLARSRSRAMAALGFLVQLPLALPPLTSGILLLFLLGPYSALGRAVGARLTDSFAGIVLAETFVAAPFLIIAARSAFASIEPVLEEVAATLGHDARSRFVRVALPVAWPAIRAGLVLAWLRAFGEFGATVMVAYHPYSLPVYTYVVFGGQGLPAMMPLLLPTLAVAVVCGLLSLGWGGATVASAGLLAPLDEPVDEPAAVRDVAAGDASPPTLSLRLVRDLGAFRLDLAWAPAARRLAILGASGSGKSLALRMIAGLEPNEAGPVMLGGEPIDALPPERRRIGYLPQDYALLPHLSVARQLAFPVDADAAVAARWVAQLGLSTLLGRRPHQLSFGQRQRVALARALARRSRLLLFDEPFAALDTPRRRRLQQSMRALQRELPAVTILVTHDPDEAALLADEVLVIDHGRVLQAGRVEDVFARPATPRVAELIGVRNIGAGRVREPGAIEVADGLVIASGDRALAAGASAMFRVGPGAIARHPEGALAAVVVALELRGGEPWARLAVAGGAASWDVPGDGWREGEPVRIDVDPAGVTVWRGQADA